MTANYMVAIAQLEVDQETTSEMANGVARMFENAETRMRNRQFVDVLRRLAVRHW